MARQTFFSFRYRADCWRASIVRNSWVTQERRAAGFFDSAEWEEVKQKNDSAIARWIDGEMYGTSVTVVLIGADTAGKKWINYEIQASHGRGNGMLGIYVHQLKDRNGRTSVKGLNPFDNLRLVGGDGRVVSYPVYDWVDHDGYANMGRWIEDAARRAGK